mmetsp:Transcript_129177/g.306555  ORF Transcript_129177/g.306555 Transcript_129177/m.306555 type:complete len:445 (-) Transcript_129177:163-1497(-)
MTLPRIGPMLLVIAAVIMQASGHAQCNVEFAETGTLLQTRWAESKTGKMKQEVLEAPEVPEVPISNATGYMSDDDFGSEMIISWDLDEIGMANWPTSKRGIFHRGLWATVHWDRHHQLPEGWGFYHVLKSGELFDWTALGLCFVAALVLRWFWLWQDCDEKKFSSHVLSMCAWLLVAGCMALAMFLRFGKADGVDWIAGYFFELFFMLENVFVFRSVITSLSLPSRTVSRVLEGVVWAQIMFEAVFFLGLAHKLRSVHFLPHLLGLGLACFGLSTMLETGKSQTPMAAVASVLQNVTPPTSERDDLDEGFLTFEGKRLQLTTAGVVLIALLLVDFLCEIDTVLTKIEEIPNPFVAFSSSALAAFSLPELFLLSQDLLFRFPLVKSGMGIILCMLGVQLVLANILVVQPLVTCLLMMIVILVCIVLSILRGVTPQSHCAEAALES